MTCLVRQLTKIRVCVNRSQGGTIPRRHHGHVCVLLAIHQRASELGLCCIVAEHRSFDIDRHPGTSIPICLPQLGEATERGCCEEAKGQLKAKEAKRLDESVRILLHRLGSLSPVQHHLPI